MTEAASVTLERAGQRHPAPLTVSGTDTAAFLVHGLPVTDQMRRSYRDERKATDHGACAVAILIIKNLLDLHVIEEACPPSGFDYWVKTPDSFLFQEAQRLEVSGMLRQDESRQRSRLAEKNRQVLRGSGDVSRIIVVVEFSRFLALIDRRP
jgi:hypothetical protein